MTADIAMVAQLPDNPSVSKFVPLLGAATFWATQVLLPATRMSARRLFTPAGVAIGLFALQLVVLPVLIVVKTSQGFLPTLPAPSSVQQALLFECGAYLAFALGLTISAARRSRRMQPESDNELVEPAERREIESLGRLPWIFAAIGLLGLALRFHSPGELLSYLHGQNRSVLGQQGDTSTSPVQAASLFLRPFLGFAGAWLLLVPRPPRVRIPGAVLRCATGAAFLLLGYGTYNYNRGALFVPFGVTVLVHIARRRKGHALLLLSVLPLIFAAALTWGGQRQQTLADLQGAPIVDHPTLLDTVELYGNAQQFVGFGLEHDPNVARGNSLLSSVVQPVPVLGKGHRAYAGSAYYQALLGRGDQVLPAVVELDWNGGVAAVVVALFAVGYLMDRLDVAFSRARSRSARFSLAFFAMWVGFLIVGSVAVVAQVLVYFSAPHVIAALARRRQAVATSRRHPRIAMPLQATLDRVRPPLPVVRLVHLDDARVDDLFAQCGLR